jgi:dethiobiotin synthetase
MALRFLISGTDLGVGKTMVGCALAFAFKVRGLKTGIMKPIETGCVERDGHLIAADAASLAAAASSDLPPHMVCQFRYRSNLAPAAAAAVYNATPPDFATIAAAAREVIARYQVVLIEECGGLAAPLDWQHTYTDLARSLGLEIILVVANRAGFINAAVLMADYAARHSVRVRGLIVNALDRESSAAVQRDAEFLERATGLGCLGTVRFKEPLGLGIVEQLLAS